MFTAYKKANWHLENSKRLANDTNDKVQGKVLPYSAGTVEQ